MTDEKKSAERADEEAREDVVQEEATREPVHNPLWQSATVDTTGGGGPRIEDVSPIFAQAKIDAFSSAQGAVEEDDVHPEGVVLPEDDGKRTNEEAIASLDDAKAKAEDDLDAVVNPEHETTSDAPYADAQNQADKAEQAKESFGS